MAYVEGDFPITTTTNNGNGFWNGDGIWAIILFAMIFGWGGNWGGFGGNGNGFNGVNDVNSAVQRGFDTNSIMNKLDTLTASVGSADKELLQSLNGVGTNIITSGNATNMAINGLGYQVQNGFAGVGTQIGDLRYSLASEACDIRNAISMQTRDITDAQRQGTDAILSFLTNEKISSLQARNSELAGELSQSKQTQNIINALRPVAQPAYITCSPFESTYGMCGQSVQ